MSSTPDSPKHEQDALELVGALLVSAEPLTMRSAALPPLQSVKPHLHGQQTLQALAVEVALHADDEAHAALRHLAGVEVAGVPVLLVFVLVIIPLDCTSRA